ncbi:MAG: DegT/DnrJ/EryC1/StrS family aminotransferase [Thermoplasmatales archaeon]|nr:DegT/DnrJ/EryC1/StrS family aminotransferase [Thermoplasmatales archaeon]
MDIKIPLLRPYFNAEELEEVKKVLDSGWVAQGPKVKELENKIKNYLNVKYAIAVTNCTAALHLSLLSIGIKKGDEVLVSDYTFPATGHSVVYCGAKPVFVDIDLETYNIKPDLICDKITKKTKAIIPVHTFGQPADMGKIIDIAKDYDLKVIEDAACALGAKFNNKFAGIFGDTGCFSFHARKGITTGEGGMVVTNNKELAEKIRKLSVFGMQATWEREQKGFFIPEFNTLGYNYKMSDITAAIGVAQLPRLEKIIKRKQELALYWDKKLKNIESISSPYVDKNARHIFQSYVALVDKNINRNKLIETLRKGGIQTQIGTYASHIQPVYNSQDNCSNSLDIFNRALALPLYYNLTEGDIDLAASWLKKSLEKIK